MTDSEVERRFAWGSPRLREWAAASFTFDPLAQDDLEALKALWLAQRKAVFPVEWPALFDFQDRFGGLCAGVDGRGHHGIARWLRDPKWFSRGVYRANRALKTWDVERNAPVRHEIRGRWLGLIRFIDLDFGDFVDEDGCIFLIDQLGSRAYPIARDSERYFEKRALSGEIAAARGLATGDSFIEVEGWIGDELARAASIPVVPEATDHVSRHYWNGIVSIEEGPRFGNPKARGTRVSSGDFDRVSAIAALAWPHLRGRDRAIRVIGWPNGLTYGLQKKLAAEHPKMTFVVMTTYP